MHEATPPHSPPLGPRMRKPTLPLVQKENDNIAKQLHQSDKQVKMLQKALKAASGGTGNRRTSQSDEEEEDEIESQDEADQFGGQRLGGGFTSIHSQGIVKTSGLPVAQQLFREPPRRALQAPFRPVQQRHEAEKSPFSYQLGQPEYDDEHHSSPAVHPGNMYDDLPLDQDMIENSGRVGHGRSPTASVSQMDHAWIHANASSLSHSSSSSHKRSRPLSPLPSSSPASSSPTPKRKKLAPAPFHADAKPGKVPKASDYVEGMEQLILDAAREYACFIIGTAALPTPTLHSETAKRIWSQTCAKVDEAYQLDPRILKIITARGSWARGIIKDAAKRHFPTVYHFRKGKSDATKDRNKDLRHSLLKDDAFHHKDIPTLTGFAQSKIIVDILESTIFKDATGLGVKYRQYFSPISPNTLALVITSLEFLLDQYITSEQDTKKGFEESLIKLTFAKHLGRVNDWCSLNPEVTTNIRTKLFKRLMSRAGATDVDCPPAGLSTAARNTMKAKLEAHTGETDSENED
ncbi:hypothetical protein C8J56DRAFT_896999 [Mycena floridula]|nr:hypothetical protein C8J56DRAFT_896999 [Mycena floridula]